MAAVDDVPTEGATPVNGDEDARQHVIVVGGGVAGLVAARELAAGGIRVTLFEASDRLGGKVQRHSVGGITLDAGAESFATRGGTVVALLEELGLGDRVVPPDPHGAWLLAANGRAVPLPKAGLLGIPSVPLARDVIAVVGLPGALRAQLDALMSGFVGSRSTDLGTLVRKRMGRAVLERLVAPVTTAVHSRRPEQLALSVVAPRLAAATLSEGSLARAVLTLRSSAPAGSAVLGLDGGISVLVDALVADLQGRVEVHLASTVRSADAGGVVFADGTRHAADHVVLAAELGEQTGTPITLATLVVRCPELDGAPRGSGVIVTPGARGVRAKAITHATAKWGWLRREAGDRHVLRLSYETAPDDIDALRDLARVDAETLLGVRIPPASVLAFERRRWRGPGAPPGPAEPDGSAEAGQDADTGAGPTVVGERVSGAGLAGAIASAREGGQSVIARLTTAHGIRFTDL